MSDLFRLVWSDKQNKTKKFRRNEWRAYLFKRPRRKCFRSPNGSDGTARLFLSGARACQLESLVLTKEMQINVKPSPSFITHIQWIRFTSKLSETSYWLSLTLLMLSKLFHGRKSKTRVPSFLEARLSNFDGPPLAHRRMANWVADTIELALNRTNIFE